MHRLRPHKAIVSIFYIGSLLLIAKPASAQIFEGSTVNTSITKPSFGQTELYGLSLPTDFYGTSITREKSPSVTISGESSPTRHYRWGNQTGIGNSFNQTTSPTSESRAVRYSNASAPSGSTSLPSNFATSTLGQPTTTLPLFQYRDITFSDARISSNNEIHINHGNGTRSTALTPTMTPFSEISTSPEVGTDLLKSLHGSQTNNIQF